MTPEAFKNTWIHNDEPLSPISLSRLAKFSLAKSTSDFLAIAGLPVYAAPDLSFIEDTDDVFYGISSVAEHYNFVGNEEQYDKYVMIGNCRDGDAIAIDTSDNDKKNCY